MSLLNFFNPFGGSLQPGAGFGATYSPVPQLPDDGRTPYTGTFQTGVDARTEAGNQNNYGPNGAQLGPTGAGGGSFHNGPVPIGGWSQLGSVANGAHYGYQGGQFPSQWDPNAGDVNGRPLSGPNGPLPSDTPAPAAPHNTPKPGEPPQQRQPMMGQWGGGGWNVGSGAPASAQPMWLGSMNGGNSWGQAPSYNATAPQQGQQTSMWHTAPNQDADSPTWVQRG